MLSRLLANVPTDIFPLWGIPQCTLSIANKCNARDREGRQLIYDRKLNIPPLHLPCSRVGTTQGTEARRQCGAGSGTHRKQHLSAGLFYHGDGHVLLLWHLRRRGAEETGPVRLPRVLLGAQTDTHTGRPGQRRGSQGRKRFEKRTGLG